MDKPVFIGFRGFNNLNILYNLPRAGFNEKRLARPEYKTGSPDGFMEAAR